MPATRPLSLSSLFLCVLALGLAACGGGGSSDPGPTGPQFSFQGPTLYVTSTADSGPGTLRNVLADAPAGAKVFFHDSIEGQTVTLTDWIHITRSVSINGGPSGNEMTISGGNATGLFEILTSDPVQFTSLNFIDGRGGWAGAIRTLFGNVRIWASVFADNESTLRGGAIFNGGLLIVQGCHFEQNEAKTGGAIYASGNHETRIERTSFLWNTARDGEGGGALYVSGGRLMLSSTTLVWNTTALNDPGLNIGGAVRATDHNIYGGATIEIYGSTITDNTAMDGGGGLHVDAEPGNTLVVRQSIIAENSGGSDPDVYIHGNVLFDAAYSRYNLIGEAAGGPFWNGLGNNQVGAALAAIDPQLSIAGPGPGKAWGRTPQVGSPARNVVPVADVLGEYGLPLERDQDNVSRLDSGNADIGALEH